jgi:YbbR domain-containing protein
MFGQNKKGFKTRQKVFTFLFFFLLASLFWLLNKLNNTYSADITYPIKYVQYNPDKEMVKPIPSEITLNVTGQGYALLRNMLLAKYYPVTFRVVSLNLLEIPSKDGRFLLFTKTLKENIQRQLGSDLQLNYISPDTLLYIFSPLIHKKVKVIPDVEVKTATQYMQEGRFIVIPDSVVISGPQSTIDTINSIKSKPSKILNVKKSTSLEVELITPEKTSLSSKVVQVTIPIDKYTEINLNVPVKAVNVPENKRLITFPPSVSVICRVSLSNYKKVSASLVTANVDFNETNIKNISRLKVNLANYPSFIKVVSYTPKNVEYLIEKND